jgi:hypothetical protein
MKWFLILVVPIFFSCQPKEYKYQIYNPKYLDSGNSAYFFTDTIQFESDTMFWINSDGTKTIISIQGGKDCQIKKLK